MCEKSAISFSTLLNIIGHDTDNDMDDELNFDRNYSIIKINFDDRKPTPVWISLLCNAAWISNLKVGSLFWKLTRRWSIQSFDTRVPFRTTYHTSSLISILNVHTIRLDCSHTGSGYTPGISKLLNSELINNNHYLLLDIRKSIIILLCIYQREGLNVLDNLADN